MADQPTRTSFRRQIKRLVHDYEAQLSRSERLRYEQLRKMGVPAVDALLSIDDERQTAGITCKNPSQT